VKEENQKISVSKDNKISSGEKYPIKFARTRAFDTAHIKPVNPLYIELAHIQKLIFPFESTLSSRAEWQRLPFEDYFDIKLEAY